MSTLSPHMGLWINWSTCALCTEICLTISRQRTCSRSNFDSTHATGKCYHRISSTLCRIYRHSSMEDCVFRFPSNSVKLCSARRHVPSNPSNIAHRTQRCHNAMALRSNILGLERENQKSLAESGTAYWYMLGSFRRNKHRWSIFITGNGFYRPSSH
jgi:hypothetical protein